MDEAIKELERESKYKENAHLYGLIRPFLFLISMHPLTRVSLASKLSIKLWKYEEFGDSHFESWQILSGHQKKSLQAKLTELFGPDGNWFRLLYRVIKLSVGKTKMISKKTKDKITAFRDLKPEGLEASKIPLHPHILAIEECLLSGSLEVMDSLLNEYFGGKLPEEWAYTKLLASSEAVQPFIEKLRNAGFKNVNLMGFLAASALRSRFFHLSNSLDGWAQVLLLSFLKKFIIGLIDFIVFFFKVQFARNRCT